jgi:hypothetical protein
MSVNFRKGANLSLIDRKGILIPSSLYGVNVDTETEELPDTDIGVYADGFGDPNKVPHSLTAPLFASRILVNINVSAGGINKTVNTTLNAGRTRVLTDDQDDDGGDAFTSIHDAFNRVSRTAGDVGTYTQLFYAVREGSSELSLSLFLPSFSYVSPSAFYYSIPNVWRLPFSLTGILYAYDEDDLIEEQYGVGGFGGGQSSSDALKVFGASYKSFSEADLSGEITVENWLGEIT